MEPVADTVPTPGCRATGYTAGWAEAHQPRSTWLVRPESTAKLQQNVARLQARRPAILFIVLLGSSLSCVMEPFPCCAFTPSPRSVTCIVAHPDRIASCSS